MLANSSAIAVVTGQPRKWTGNALTMHILVVRNDKLGDFMLAWPTFSLLKHHWPDIHISVLVPSYTAPMAEICPWIDEVVIDQPEEGLFALRNSIRLGHYDAVLTLFSSGRLGLATCLAGIPYRLAPATKLVQFCYNHRLTQRRSRSKKPEYAYNLDLAYRLLRDLKGIPGHMATAEDSDDYLPKELTRPLLQFNPDEIRLLRETFCRQHKFEPHSRLIFIHPGSGGSANNLSLDQYARLATTLKCEEPFAFVISAGPGEEEAAGRLKKMLAPLPATVLRPQGGLPELSRHLQFADLFISGSTGPLHIAGALDRPTAAFYPRHRSATPLRWQTLNAPDKRLAFVPPPGAEAEQVASIDVEHAAREISEKLLP